MTVRISELNELSSALSQTDILPVVDLSAGETKKIEAGNLIAFGISGAPSGIIDLSKLDQGSATKLNNSVLIDTGVAADSYGSANTVAQFVVNAKGVITSASGVPIVIASSGVTGLAPVATSGTYASLSGLPTLGTLSSQDADSVAISGGTVSGVVLVTGDATISGGTISGITDLAIDDGGTGASTAADARTNLGLAIGTDVQPYSAVLSGIATQFDQPDEIVYASASGVVAGTPFTSFARSIISGSTASGVRDTLELGSIALQDANSVAISGGTISGVVLVTGDVTISGGTISGITDLAIDDGGTGASSAADARTNLGLAIGTDVQAYASALSGITATASGGDLFFYTTSSGAVSSAPFSSAARDIVAPTTLSGIRDALGLGDVAILDTIIIDSGNVAPNAIATEAIIDQSITTAKIATNAVSLSLLAQTAEDTILGRATAGSGNVEAIACTAAARSILDDATIADIRTTLGLGNLATENGTLATGINTGDQTITLTGDVTGTGTDTFAATIADDAVTEGKLGTSAVTTDKIAADAVTADKLADSSSVIVTGSSPTGDGAFIGQQWVNTNDGFEYTWTGSIWQRLSGLATLSFVESGPLALSVAYPDAFSAEITAGYDTQAANTVWAGPASGSDVAPTFRAIVPEDLPDATVSTKGVIHPGTGLIVSSGTLNHSNAVSGTTLNGFTFDNEGHISAAVALAATDIPSLDTGKITTGTFGTTFIADNAITGEKLADYANAKIGETLPVAEHIGQIFFNPIAKTFFLWDGNVWQPIGVSTGAIIFAGTYDASTNLIASTTTVGSGLGLTVSGVLPAADVSNTNYYVVVSTAGSGVAPAPVKALAPPDLLLSDGSAWQEIDTSSTFQTQAAGNISFTPAGDIGASNVQAAIEEVSIECRNADNVASGTLAVARGGTGLGSYSKGDLIVASGSTVLAKLAAGTNSQVLRANSSTATGLEWGADYVGTVTNVTSATAALTIVSGTTVPALTVRSATTSVNGIVQLSDSTSTTSSTLAATPTAVKAAYDLANAALPKAGGVITGALEIGTAGSLVFEGSIDDGNETTLTVANPTADRTITLPNTTGTVITTGDSGTITSTMIASGTIVNANINNSAAIAYSKLALSSGIVDADISGSAAIALSKLATGALPTGITIASGNIIDGTIVDADINASAAIADTKLATISTAGKVSGTAITSGLIDTTGNLIITNTSPTIRLVESGGTATHSQSFLVRDNDGFQHQTRDNTGTFVSSDYLIPANTSGATDHIWRIANTEQMRIDSDGNVKINGKVGIGDFGSATLLRIIGDIPDDDQSFAVGITVGGVASTSTDTIYGFISDIEPTTSAANTVTSVFRYLSRQINSFGSATVTNQYGFLAESSLTGATNNYGFFGGITDATGRWNFYAAGTAPNYFAGDVRIGNSAGVDITSSSSNGHRFFSAGNVYHASAGTVPLYVGRNTNDGVLVAFHQAGTQEGSISVSGSTVSYNPFLGSHWGRLVDGSKPDILPGTILDTVDQLIEWKQAKFTVDGEEKIAAYNGAAEVGDTVEIDYEGTLYSAIVQNEEEEPEELNKHVCVKVNDTASSKAVFGVFLGWDHDIPDNMISTWNDLYCAAVGNYFVRIADGETLEIGSLIEADGNGCGIVQNDDIIRSKTVAKITSTIPQKVYDDGSFLVTCVLCCG